MDNLTIAKELVLEQIEWFWFYLREWHQHQQVVGRMELKHSFWDIDGDNIDFRSLFPALLRQRCL